MRLSELTELRKQHLIWRLDHNTGCGLVTACHITEGGWGDLDLVEVFEKVGQSDRSAKILAGKVGRFEIENIEAVTAAHRTTANSLERTLRLDRAKTAKGGSNGKEM